MRRKEFRFTYPEIGIVRAVPDLSNDTLLLFIHGFGGHYESTWGELSLLISEDNDFSKADFCFLGYGSTLGSVSGLAMYLADMLTRAIKGTEPFPRSYQKVLTVSHSLGGLGLRSALLNLAAQDSKTILSRVSFCLLAAPPLFGAHPARLASLFPLLWDFLSLFRPVLKDLSRFNGEYEAIRQAYDGLAAVLAAPYRPISDVRWAFYDRIAVLPPRDYAPVPPDTQAMEPYNHFTLVKPYNRKHRFYAALRTHVFHQLRSA